MPIKRTPVNVQLLPSYIPREHRRKPSPKHLLDHPDREDLVEIMQDSLLAGMAALQGVRWPLMMYDAYPEAFDPAPGVCAWTWYTVVQATHIEEVDWEPLLNFALKPSADFPPHLQAVTPRYCLHLTGMHISQASACMERFRDDGILTSAPSRAHLHRFLALQTYGPEIDKRNANPNLLRELPRMPRPFLISPRNSKLTHAQYAGLTHAPPNTPTTVAIDMVESTFDADLGPWLHHLFLRGVEVAQELARKANPRPDDALRVLTEDMSVFEAEAVRRWLVEPWDFDRCYPNIEDDPDERLIQSLVRSMFIAGVCRSRSMLFSAPTLLGLPLLAGISPACIVRGGIAMLKRTGYSYVQEHHVLRLIDDIQKLPEAKSPQARTLRGNLMAELEGLLDELLATQDRLDPSLVEDIHRAYRYRSFPAWGVFGPLDEPDDD